MEKKKQKPIQSVQRAIAILDCFTPLRPSLSLPEISDMTNLNINTARGLVNTLLDNELLTRDRETGNYKLGFYFMTKASMIQQDIDRYVKLFKPFLDKTSAYYHFSTSLQVVNQDRIFSVYCAYPPRDSYYIVMSEYTDLPLSATSSGKLLLLDQWTHGGEDRFSQISFHAYTPFSLQSETQLKQQLQEIQKNGYATEIEEFMLDVGSLALPLYNKDGRLRLTVSATFFVKKMPTFKEELLKDFQRVQGIWKRYLEKEGQ